MIFTILNPISGRANLYKLGKDAVSNLLENVMCSSRMRRRMASKPTQME